jgi:hypothetical protein
MARRRPVTESFSHHRRRSLPPRSRRRSAGCRTGAECVAPLVNATGMPPAWPVSTAGARGPTAPAIHCRHESCAIERGRAKCNAAAFHLESHEMDRPGDGFPRGGRGICPAHGPPPPRMTWWRAEKAAASDNGAEILLSDVSRGRRAWTTRSRCSPISPTSRGM